MSYKVQIGACAAQRTGADGFPGRRGRSMCPERCTLLVVDDEPYILPTLKALLMHEFDVVTAPSADHAEQILSTQRIDILLSAQRMPRRTGVELLEWAKLYSPRTIRLLMTGYSELEDAVEAINK